MSPKTKKIVQDFVVGATRVLLIPYYLGSVIYWWVVRSIVIVWGKRGLHAIAIGELVGGESKTRSMYREDMLLKTISLFVELRGTSCLDLACNDGFWSFRLGQLGLKKLVGLDRSGEGILRANFLKRVYYFPGFQFKQRDVFQFLYEENKASYDIVLLLSIIYHLPADKDWARFFKTIYQHNNNCLIIDTRWFDNDEYWYDKTSRQGVIKTEGGEIEKWRPTRQEVISHLRNSGYQSIVEINPSVFLTDCEAAFGDGDPYSVQNVADYISEHRTVLIAYKRETLLPDVAQSIKVL